MKHIFIIAFVSLLFVCGCNTEVSAPSAPANLTVVGQWYPSVKRLTITINYSPVYGVSHYDLFYIKPGESDWTFWLSHNGNYPYSVQFVARDGSPQSVGGVFSAPGTYSFAMRSRNYNGISGFSETKTIELLPEYFE
jgi:hypothetical protein